MRKAVRLFFERVERDESSESSESSLSLDSISSREEFRSPNAESSSSSFSFSGSSVLVAPPPAGFLIGIGVFRCLYRRLRRRIGTKNTTASRCYETQCKRDNDAAGCSELCHYSLLFRSLSSHIQLYQSLTRGKLHIYQWTHQGRSPPCCPSVFYIDIKQQRRHFIMRIHR